MPYVKVRWGLMSRVFSRDEQAILVAYHVFGRTKNAVVLGVLRVENGDLLLSYGGEVERFRRWGVQVHGETTVGPIVHPRLGVLLIRPTSFLCESNGRESTW